MVQSFFQYKTHTLFQFILHIFRTYINMITVYFKLFFLVYTSLKAISSSSSRVGISFSPAGLLTPFHLGVADHLRNKNVLTKDTVLGGSSGGALAACTSALSISPSVSLQACSQIAQRCRDFGTIGTLRVALDEALDQILLEDAHEVINTRPGAMKIAYMEVFPR